MNVKEFWDNGKSYDEYIEYAEEALKKAREKGDEEYEKYYELGIRRMNRAYKKFQADESQKEALAQKDFKGKLLVIAEPWCGDCSAAVPALARFFEDAGVRMTLRDGEPSLIGDFLTDGKEAIPKVLLLDENYEVTDTWGERPQAAIEIYQRFKADPENYPREQFYADLQKYYARNKGRDMIAEILELMH